MGKGIEMDRKDKTAVFFSILTILVIIYRDLVHNSLPFFVFSFICGVGVLCMDTTGRFLYITTLLPFCRGIPYSEMLFLTLAAEVLLVILPRRRIKGLRLYMLLIAILVIELFDYLVYDVVSHEIVYLLLYMIFTTYAVTNRVYLGREDLYIFLYGAAIILAVVSVVASSVAQYGWDYIFVYNYRFGAATSDKSVTNFNANELGLYCAMAVALCLTMFSQRKKAIWACLACIASMLGAVSVSRTYLLVLVGTWGLYFMLGRVPVKRVLVIIGMFVVMALAVAILAPDVVDWLISYFVSRFGEENTRTPIMKIYFEEVFSGVWSTFLGFSQNYLRTIDRVGIHAAHNGMEEVLVCWGIVGFAVFFKWVADLYLYALSRVKRQPKILYLSAATFWVFVQTLQLVTMHNYLTVMLLTMIPLRMGEKENERGSGNTDCIRFVQIRHPQ